jgi:ribosomal protein S18 acetylase RimI-like enzyme
MLHTAQVGGDRSPFSIHTQGIIQTLLLEGGWTTESKIVQGERATTEEIDQVIQCNRAPNILLLAFMSTDAGEEVVGTVQVQHKEGDDEAEIGLFSVSPKRQSGGIGGKLIREAIRVIKEDLQYKHAFVHVLENRTDILAWYRKLGFKETGERIAFVWPEKLLVSDLHFLTLKMEV